MAIRPPKYNSQGFTLLEMLITLAVAGIIMGFAVPSFVSWSKPLRDGSLQFKSHLSLIRSKAISSGQSYRLRPKYNTTAQYSNGIARNFVVEYAANCKVTTAWTPASQLDLDLPLTVGIPGTNTVVPTFGTFTNPLDWSTNGTGICFDSRGIVDSITTKVILKDSRGDNKAKLAVLDLTKVGNIDIITYSENTPGTFVQIPLTSQNNPQF